jgi:hypothetical protein
MTTERAEEVLEELALFEVDNANNPPPSDFDLGRAIRVLGMAESFDHFSIAIESIEVVDDEEEE